MDRPWLNHYPEGVPADVALGNYESIIHLLRETVQRFGDRPAYSNLGKTLSYGESDRLSRQFGAFLQSLGLKRGERMALMLPNLLQHPIAMFGALRIGLIVVNVNPLYTARELRHQLIDSGARAIVILENFASTLQEIIGDTHIEHIILTGVGDLQPWYRRVVIHWVLRHVRRAVPTHDLDRSVGFRRALARGGRLSLREPDLKPADIAFIQYTGGTTGVAKGAMLSHRNMLANIQQISAWFRPVCEQGQEIMITALPLYHVYSLMCNCLSFLPIGCLNVLITDPRDISGLVKAMSRWPFTMMTGVNTLYRALLRHPRFPSLDFSHLKIVNAGGMAVQDDVAERWSRTTGCAMLQGYGLTEASPVVTINPVGSKRFTGSIGLPIPSTWVRIVDDGGRELAPGETGELEVKGPQVMEGYWQRPDETRDTVQGEWLRTGDMARMDEQGFFYIVDRRKDLINVSGFKVFPNEIENVLAGMPGISEVAVVGVPDEHSGEAVKAVIVSESGSSVGEAEVLAYCRHNLTGYKVPRHIEFRHDLPKSSVGKILRRQLRETP